jgi:DNA-binding protein HU-beta
VGASKTALEVVLNVKVECRFAFGVLRSSSEGCVFNHRANRLYAERKHSKNIKIIKMKKKEKNNMNTHELVKEIVNRIDGSTQKDIALVVDTFQDVIKETVVSGEKVALSGFLTFEKKHVEPKSGTILFGSRKGEKWEKPACSEIKVSISKKYKSID